VADLLPRSATPVDYIDSHGHQRHADLRDFMERRWFVGAADVLPRYVMEHVQPGGWVIDAGANIGIVAGQLANAVGGTGAVWALEPLPRNVEVLRRLADENHLTQLRPLAVGAGDERAELDLRTYGGRDGGGAWASFTATWVDGGTVTVPVVPLDQLAKELGEPGPLQLLKVDVEGFESRVLDGATALLERHRPPMFIEFNAPILEDAGTTCAALLAHCEAMGYRVADASLHLLSELGRPGCVTDLLLVANR
jgi:FkbM family methyltransferase